MTEAQVTFDVMSKWGAHPRLRLWRMNAGAAKVKGQFVKFGVPGQGDYSGLIAPWGQRLEVEFKATDGVQSEDQKTFQAIVERFGGVYVLVHSLEEFDAAMAALGIFR
jgi:hypothetical protein